MSLKLGRSKPLERRAGLKRSPLRRRSWRRVETATEREARMAWCDPHAGNCECGSCGTPGRFSMHLESHHVVSKSKLKAIGRLDVLWDPRNRMRVHPDCHERHTNHSRKIRIDQVPVDAMAFAVDVLGEAAATAYFLAHYDCSVVL